MHSVHGSYGYIPLIEASCKCFPLVVNLRLKKKQLVRMESVATSRLLHDGISHKVLFGADIQLLKKLNRFQLIHS